MGYPEVHLGMGYPAIHHGTYPAIHHGTYPAIHHPPGYTMLACAPRSCMPLPSGRTHAQWRCSGLKRGITHGWGLPEPLRVLKVWWLVGSSAQSCRLSPVNKVERLDRIRVTRLVSPMVEGPLRRVVIRLSADQRVNNGWITVRLVGFHRGLP